MSSDGDSLLDSYVDDVNDTDDDVVAGQSTAASPESTILLALTWPTAWLASLDTVCVWTLIFAHAHQSWPLNWLFASLSLLPSTCGLLCALAFAISRTAVHWRKGFGIVQALLAVVGVGLVVLDIWLLLDFAHHHGVCELELEGWHEPALRGNLKRVAWRLFCSFSSDTTAQLFSCWFTRGQLCRGLLWPTVLWFPLLVHCSL